MRKAQGYMLVTVLIFLAIMVACGGGMFLLSAYDFVFTKKAVSNSVLIHIADAGVEDALYRLNTGEYANFSANLTPSVPSGITTWGSYSVTITPLSGSRYKVESTGTLYGKSKKITAIASTTPYSQYLQWNDVENYSGNNDSSMRGTWIPAGETYNDSETIDGPVYINQDLWTYWGPRLLVNPKKPIFKGSVTINGGLHYHTTDGWGDPQNANELACIFQNPPTTGSNPKAWPFTGDFNADFAVQKKIANGNSTVYPTSTEGQFPSINEIKMSPNGGLYIMNGWEGAWFGQTAQGKQMMRLGRGYVGGAQRDRHLEIIWDTANNRTLVHTSDEYLNPTSADTIYSGVPKVIWMAGSTSNFGGQVREKITLFNAGWIRFTEDMTVIDTDGDGDITDENGMLGIVTPYLWVPNGDANSGWPHPPNKLQAAVIATGTGTNIAPGVWLSGSFCALDSLRVWSSRPLNVWGSLMQKQRGSIGLYNADWLTPSVGYYKNFKYDTRLVDNSTPYFPNNGKFYIRYWVIN